MPELKAICSTCQNEATCFGVDEESRLGFGCDDCCGHGEEMGWCIPIEDFVEEVLESRRKQSRHERREASMLKGMNPQAATARALSLISQERFEQIEKHGFDAKHDLQLPPNTLLRGVAALITMDRKMWPGEFDDEIFNRILEKSNEDRLVVIAAMAQAELEASILRDNSYEV